MAEFHISTFLPQTRDATLANLVYCAGLPKVKELRADTHKPFLQESTRKTRGLAITHIRRSIKPFSLMAVSLWPNIGIDAELWPGSGGDEVFLKSIIAPEETELATSLKAKGLDAGLFLWVAKEAALKASGMVMVDPRDIVITLIEKNYAGAAKANNSTAMVSPAQLAFFTLTAPETNETVLVALSAVKEPKAERTISIEGTKTLGLRPLNLDSH